MKNETIPDWTFTLPLERASRNKGEREISLSEMFKHQNNQKEKQVLKKLKRPNDPKRNKNQGVR